MNTFEKVDAARNELVEQLGIIYKKLPPEETIDLHRAVIEYIAAVAGCTEVLNGSTNEAIKAIASKTWDIAALNTWALSEIADFSTINEESKKKYMDETFGI